VRLYGIGLTSAIAFLETAVMNAPARRRGWGVEASRLLVAYAMDALGLHRIEAKVFAYNTPSINALTRNSFQQEGCSRRVPPRWEALRHPRLLHPGGRGAISAAAGAVPYMGFWERAA
jgi:hypothetical protein